ncbi:hypothetical protein AAG906_020328 [Vitis piasezkii]
MFEIKLLFLQCHNGHTLCSSCKARVVNKCPTCRQQLGDIRCLSLEKMAESLELHCKNEEFGCPEIILTTPSSCMKTRVTSDHTTAHGMDAVMLYGCKFKLEFLIEDLYKYQSYKWDVTIINCFDMAFLSLIGNQAKADNYSYSLEIGGNERKLTFEETTMPMLGTYFMSYIKLLKKIKIPSLLFNLSCFDFLAYGNANFFQRRVGDYQKASIMSSLDGPIYYNGVYHMLYHYNSYVAVWGNITWAHSISYVLVKWVNLGHALNPTDPCDINGCWTGSATILPGEELVIIYIGADTEIRQFQNRALAKNISDPLHREWMKSPHNPIMTPIDGIVATLLKVWRILDGSTRNGHGTTLFFK